MQAPETLQEAKRIEITIKLRSGRSAIVAFVKDTTNELEYLLLQNLIELQRDFRAPAVAVVKDLVIVKATFISLDAIQKKISLRINEIRLLLKNKGKLEQIFSKLNKPKEFQQHSENLIALLFSMVEFSDKLCENNYLEDSLLISRPLAKFLIEVNNRIDNLKEKYRRANKIFCESIQDYYPMVLKNVAYCHLQTENYLLAAVVSTEALTFLKRIFPAHNMMNVLLYDVFSKGTIIIYNIKQNNLSVAKKLLDEVILILDRDKISFTEIGFVYTCKLMGEKWLTLQKFEEAEKYLKLALKTINNYIRAFLQNKPALRFSNNSSPRRLYPITQEWLFQCKKEIDASLSQITEAYFQQKCIQLQQSVESLDILFVKQQPLLVNKKELTLTLTTVDAESAQTISDILIKNGNFSCTLILPNQIKFGDVLRLDVILFEDLLHQAAHPPKSTQAESVQPTPKQHSIKPCASSQTELDVLLAASYQLHKETPLKKKPTAQAAPSETTKPNRAPKENELNGWLNDISTSLALPYNEIFSLANEPYIPAGHWFAYLDLNKLSEVDSSLIKDARAVLSRGLLSSNGQAVKPALEELKGTGYSFKIRLLGPSGKGDIRFYGWIKTVDDRKKIIIFDHIELASHKKINLPTVTGELSAKPITPSISKNVT